MEKFGAELILDLHGCDPGTFTRKSISRYFASLCKLIDMKREASYFWDDLDVDQKEKAPYFNNDYACFLIIR